MGKDMERRTRSGKIVGSYRQPLEGWTYWPEKNSTTGEDGFVVVAELYIYGGDLVRADVL